MANLTMNRWMYASAIALALLMRATPAVAQVDPLLFLKDVPPNVLLVVDTSARMQRDADGTYYDPGVYSRSGNKAWHPTIGVTSSMNNYRRKLAGFVNTSVTASTPLATTTNITV